MKRIVNKSIRDEKGQALILIMILLLVGGLIITPLLGFMSTGLIVGQVFEKKMNGFYAADAGIEDALWKIMNDQIPADPYQLTDVNGMLVTVDIVEVDELYGVTVGSGGTNYSWFALESEFLDYVGDESWGIYNYRLRLTNKRVGIVKIERITVSYSAELSYLSGLTDEDVAGLKPGYRFNDGIPTLPEIQVGDSKILTWEFRTPPPPRLPQIYGADDPDDPGSWVTVTCTFQLEGPPGAPEISFFLVKANDADIGTVWEYKPFKITAVADKAGTTVTTVEAGVLEGSSTVLVRSWEIS